MKRNKKPKGIWEIFNFTFALGTGLLGSLIVGIAIGYYLDKLLNSSPVCLLGFTALGIWVGFRDIFKFLR
ncbi:MAG TPA: AtpZ/AtpI family protein [Dictyoglomaceae bacterium]|nr:AtpZ/AtpI family protein [Dictyoglomaceae bacterium]HOL39285.1 AtpZ/AtpI family protein [Dictyoglomaceae bacterium]HOP95233.1 AtpZ/AtpI family protein [Dictyoglomaceae bacterium]HPP15856.1 AtpZ/AtpI family protein [Dictyoglomaceae bacterium]HPU44008.1 AtpZ/AtpI family protein [Dictyoglomaceae bacterium]